MKERYLKKYPHDIVERAFKKFPVEMEDVVIHNEWVTEDRFANQRHWYIIGAVEERKRTNKTK